MAALYSIDDSVMKFEHLAKRLQPPEGLHRENWAQHPNGRGWVEISAKVASTAYVGPNAIVTDEAQILGRARLEKKAVVGGNAIIADQAVITDKARINEMAKILGKSRISGTASIGGFAVVRNLKLNNCDIRPRASQDRRVWRNAQPQASSETRSKGH